MTDREAQKKRLEEAIARLLPADYCADGSQKCTHKTPARQTTHRTQTTHKVTSQRPASKTRTAKRKQLADKKTTEAQARKIFEQIDAERRKTGAGRTVYGDEITIR